MGPGRLLEWERLLASDVAVALLLLGALLVLGALVLAWGRALYTERRELEREYREHLKADAELFAVAVDRAVRDLIESTRDDDDDADRVDTPPGAAPETPAPRTQA